MRTRLVTRAMLVALATVTAPALGQKDQVRLTKGGTVTGQIVATTADLITLRTPAGETRRVPTIEARAVLFADEPSALTQARINAANGGYATALRRLKEIDARELDRDRVRDEARFLAALCEVRLAAVGQGDAAAAYKRLGSFLKARPDSHHTYAAVEALGDLLVAIGRHDRAASMYARLAKAPFPSLSLRAEVFTGRALQAKGDHGAALERFEQALKLEAEGEGVEAERLSAKLGSAWSLAETGDLDAGVELAREVVLAAGDGEPAKLARGYNTLGRCYEAAGKPIDALLAYLHTDLLFDNDPDAHAEALSRLAVLWNAAGKPEDARDAASRLRGQYASSRWAAEAG
ncbi:MAG: hypothetical protein AAF805_13930 [Planctomycetota bacterium]